MKLSALDVLAQHLELVERLGDGRTSALARYLNSVALMDKAVQAGTEPALVLTHAAANAYPYWVTANMTQPIDLRAVDMDPLTRVGEDEHVPPREFGFVVFEHPIRYPELRGRETIVHAVLWGPCADQDMHTGWIVQTFNDLYREPDDIAALLNPAVRATLGRWHGISAYWMPRHMRVGPATYEPTAEDLRRVAEDADAAFITRNMGRVFLALWSMLNETLPGAVIERAPRAQARRMQRLALPTEVSVMTLRRAVTPVEHPGTGTSPAYRTWVDEYRKRVWVGSGADRRCEMRKITAHWWPADPSLPIRQRPKVNRLAR